MRSPTLKSRSPSACAEKSYNATTYLTRAGLGLSGGGGGGARFPAAADAAMDDAEEYGGGGASKVVGEEEKPVKAFPEAFPEPKGAGGGGGLFLDKVDVDALDAERPTGAPAPPRVACRC